MIHRGQQTPSMLPKLVILITGGSRGVGAAIAQALLPHAQVYVTSRTPQTREFAAPVLALDVTSESSVQQVFQTLLREHTQVDILINNAGVGFFKSITEISLTEWQQAVDTNLTGAFLCSREFFRTNQSGGRIINIGSIVDQMGVVQNMGYAPSKWGLRGLSAGLNAEGLARQIYCTHISLGAVATEMWQERPGFASADMLSPTEVGKMIREICLMPLSVRMDHLTLYPPKGLL